MNKNPLIVALDVSDKEKALSLIKELKEYVSIFKVGPVLFTRYGPDIIKEIKSYGADVFLDLKFYDIPNTVGSAVEAISEMGVWGFTVHISGGKKMLKAVVDAGVSASKILGVTILTSAAEASIEKVVQLAGLAKEAGLDGVIASPLEVESIRKVIGKDFLIVTPGVRPKGTAPCDQKRIATPKDAIQKGADYIIIGRPIVKSDQPKEVVKRILNEINYLD